MAGLFREVSVLHIKTCRFCGRTFETRQPVRLYCSTSCRRQYQNRRRREERAEAAELRQVEAKPMMDPWARCDLDDWTIEEIYGNALLDPLPAGGEEG